jgi:hypothetical protein
MLGGPPRGNSTVSGSAQDKDPGPRLLKGGEADVPRRRPALLVRLGELLQRPPNVRSDRTVASDRAPTPSVNLILNLVQSRRMPVQSEHTTELRAHRAALYSGGAASGSASYCSPSRRRTEMETAAEPAVSLPSCIQQRIVPGRGRCGHGCALTTHTVSYFRERIHVRKIPTGRAE